uniref:NAC domain-containing protein n=1 Tax=Tanacetum cinerariifolium TaxID=118510 RepID=A0A699H773_TANCI|nr:NAC domain-containing protein [Tanacetum cinerariifolium]
MEPSDTFLMGIRLLALDEFIKSSVDDLVPILRELEVTSVCDDLEYDMPVNTPFPTTDVSEENFDINSPLGEYVFDFLMENVDVAGLPMHLVKYLFNHLIKNLSLTKGMSDEPLGDDSKSISYDVTFSNPLLDFNDDFILCGGTTRVMETPTFGFHHMPSPRPAAYSPTEVMYCYYHPHLTSEIPFDESKVHIDVLSVLWGNRLPIQTVRSRCQGLFNGGNCLAVAVLLALDEFIKSSVDDLVPIPRESEVTSVCDDLESDMPVNTPLPTADVREENFDINLPLGEYVFDFLMENVDVAGLPRHLVKHLFNHLIKNPSLTKGMSDEPLGDDSKSISYDVTFSNLLFNFNDDFILCNDDSLFDEEFEDISNLDPLSRLQLLMSLPC